MYSTISSNPMTSGRMKRLIVAPLAVALLLALAMATMTANAHAETLTANVSTEVDGCPVRGSALFDTNTNVLTVDYYTRSPYLFSACRVKLVTDFRHGDYTLGTRDIRVPTACALTDPSCGSTQEGTLRFNGAFQPAFLISHINNITLSAAPRER
jgi:hypothetical protein